MGDGEDAGDIVAWEGAIKDGAVELMFGSKRDVVVDGRVGMCGGFVLEGGDPIMFSRHGIGELIFGSEEDGFG